MFDTMGDAALIDMIGAAHRAEAQAASQRLAAIGVLVDRHADPEHEEIQDRFVIDRWDAVAAQVAAAQGITHALASSQMRCAYVLRHRLPAVAERFAAGDIDFRTVALIVQRTELLDDDETVRAVDTAITAALPRWERWSAKRIAIALDALVCRFDPDAVRRTRKATDDRHLDVRPLDTGNLVAEIWGVLQTPHAVALDKRLDDLAATVCPADPRTKAQLRADAVGALARGIDRMRCGCGVPSCPGGGIADVQVVVHVVANEGTLDEPENDEPAYIADFGVISGVQARQAASLPGALVRTLASDPGNHYRPSRKLDTYVRCRDQLCRFPGCSKPADSGDVDHTIPHSSGGRTMAAKLKYR